MSEFWQGYLVGCVVFMLTRIIWDIVAALIKHRKPSRKQIEKSITEMEQKRAAVLASGNNEQIEAFNAEVEQLKNKLFS